MKKMAIFLNSRSEIGGVEKMILDWLQFIDFRNIKVFLFIRKGHFSELINSFIEKKNTHNLIISYTPDIDARYIPVNFIFKRLSSLKPDILFFINSWYDAFNWKHFCTGRLFSRNIYCSIHLTIFENDNFKKKKWFGFIPGFGLWRLVKIIDMKIRFLFCKKIFVVSPLIIEQFKKYHLASSKKILLLLHGISREKIKYNRRLNEHEYVIVAAVRFVPVKKIDRLLGAFLLFGLRNKDLLRKIRLKIAGIGPLLEEFKKRVETFPQIIKERIEFLGFINDMDSLWSESDFSILTSNFEGFPITIVESMAKGCIPIFGKWLHLPNYINDNSYVVEKRNVYAFSNKIKEIVSLSVDEILLKKQSCVRLVQEKFILNINANKFLSQIDCPIEQH